MSRKSFLYINLLFVLFFFLPGLQAEEKTPTTVIDVGHGRKDPGARGVNIDEKEINLAVALKSGRLVENNAEDVRMIYTRGTGHLIGLGERVNIASRNKADLFVSTCTDAIKCGSTVQGMETYILGLARNEENSEMIMSGNSTILLEDNYQQRYEGFGPNSSESYIIFEFMQNEHMEQSISLVSEVQKSFGACRRVDRGVRQTGFLVLRKTSMPNILVELGYISNRQEEQLMRAAIGQSKSAEVLYDILCEYKKNYDCHRGNFSGVVAAPVANEETSSPGSEADILDKKQQATRQKTSVSSTTPVNRNMRGKVTYKIQLLTSSKKLSANSRLFKGYENAGFYAEKGIYEYTYGEVSDFNSIRKMYRAIAKDLRDALIIAFKDGKKVKY